MNQKGLTPIAIVLVLVVVIIISFLFVTRPFKTAENAVKPFKGGELILAEQLSYKFSEPQIGDRILFIPNNMGRVEYVGFITQVNEEGNVKTYSVISSNKDNPWIVSKDKIVWKVYFPFVSKEEINSILSSITQEKIETSPTPSTHIANTIKKCEDDLYTNNKFKFSFKCPKGFEFVFSSDDQKSYNISPTLDDIKGSHFGYGGIYISIIPKDFSSQGGSIYNYSTDETNSLLEMQIGETKAVRNIENPKLAS